MSKASHLYWIGGSPCGGKSSIAQILANQYDLHLYRIDDQIDRLMQKITPKLQPALSQWESQSWEERWMQPVEQLLEFVIKAYDEEFTLCLEEIKAISPSQPTIIEGNPLRPELVLPYLPDEKHAIWLIAQDNDLRYFYAQRTWVQQVVNECAEPEKAFNNWMDRDIAFAHQIRNSCERYQLRYVMSDQQKTIEEKAEQVAAFFQLSGEL